MRLLTVLTVFITGIVLANQVHAKDLSSQPLTRIDCDKAEMALGRERECLYRGLGRVAPAFDETRLRNGRYGLE